MLFVRDGRGFDFRQSARGACVLARCRPMYFSWLVRGGDVTWGACFPPEAKTCAKTGMMLSKQHVCVVKEAKHRQMGSKLAPPAPRAFIRSLLVEMALAAYHSCMFCKWCRHGLSFPRSVFKFVFAATLAERKPGGCFFLLLRAVGCLGV